MVSVIIPFYNTEKYIEECVRSVLSQTYTDIEILLVNDGSTDNSLSICQSIKDDRIHIVNKNNGGVSSARNTGLSISKGEYIMFVDSDDILPINSIKTLVSHMIEAKVDMVIGTFAHLYDSVIRLHKSRLSQGLYYFDSLLDKFLDDGTLSGFLIGSVCAALYKRDIILSKHIRFNEHVKNNEDGLFNFEYALISNSLFVINDIVYHYRQYSESSTSRITENNNYNKTIIDYLSFLNWDKSKYSFEKQIKVRNVSVALWNILKYPRFMNMRDGYTYIKEILNDPAIKQGIKVIDSKQLSPYKKIFYLLMRYHCYMATLICVKYIIPYLNSKISR